MGRPYKLQKRKSGYYFRYKLPSDIAAKVGKREIVRSLRTSLTHEALHHHLKLLAEVEGAIRMMRLGVINGGRMHWLWGKPSTVGEVADAAGTVFSSEQLSQLSELIRSCLSGSSAQPAAGLQLISPASRAGSTHPQSVEVSSSGAPLSIVMDEFLREIAPSLQAKTKLDYEHSFALARDLFGAQRSIDTISTKDAREFKALLLGYPSNATKKYPQLGFRAAVNRGQADQADVLAPKSINKKLSNLSNLFTWAKDNGYLTNNIFSRLGVPDKVAAKSKRDSFTAEQLGVIFTSEVFASVADRARLDNGSQAIDDFWITLIGYFTGMRLGEIAQLSVADVRQEHGVWVFEIHDRGDNRLKTANSKRRVPIHRELLRLGLIQYRDAISVGGNKELFPRVTPASDGYESSAYSKRFSRFLKRIGIKVDRRLSFHSFRHTMKDMLRSAGVEESVQRELLGHEDGSAAAQYGRGYSMGQLKEQLERVELCPSISRLYPR